MRDENHVYTANGVVLPSVTQVLKLAGIGVYAANVPLANIERAGAIGTAVHEGCQFLDEDDLNFESLDPVVLPYVVAYQRWREEYLPEWEGIELQIESPELRLAGTIDRVGKVKGQRYIVDIKTQRVKAKHWGLQTSGYRLLDGKEAGRAVLWLSSEGTFKWIPHEDDRETIVFNAILHVAHWMLDNGTKL